MGVYCLKASINLSKKAARLSFGSCLIKFTLDKFVGFLEAAWRLPGGQPSESDGTLGDAPYLQRIQNPSSVASKETPPRLGGAAWWVFHPLLEHVFMLPIEFAPVLPW